MSGKLDALLIDARTTLAKSATARPSFPASEFDDAVLELARTEKREGESEAQALDRLIYVDKDDRVRALYNAARRAEALEQPKRPSSEAVAKRVEREDAVLEHARKHARPGESEAQAFDRLARERDPELTKLYAASVA